MQRTDTGLLRWKNIVKSFKFSKKTKTSLKIFENQNIHVAASKQSLQKSSFISLGMLYSHK